MKTNFAEELKNQASYTLTENGAKALKTTGDKCLDFYGVAGALRNADETRITTLFADAYNEDPLLATKIVFYCRDIRGGLGERDTFRTLIKYMATYHPEALVKNIPLIGEYGRFDDLYSLIDTPLERHMWKYVKLQLQQDIEYMKLGRPVSLLAKWLKTADASSEKTRKLGIKTALSLGMKVPTYKRKIKTLRKYIDIVERKMSARDWTSIDYSTVSSRASLLYRDAFSRHDNERYSQYISDTLTGNAKINTGALYPYDLVHKYFQNLGYIFGWPNNDAKADDTIESLWKNLPNYVEGENNVLVVADTSGSMFSGGKITPIDVSTSLAIYFAERNTGAYHNMWMNFSTEPSIQYMKGETLYQKIRSLDYNNWGCNTDLKAVFDKVLDIAIKTHDLPKVVIIISDMEIDYCSNILTNFYDMEKLEFAFHGFELPNLIFWNVNSRHDVFHANCKYKGVQLASGASASTFKNVIDAIGLTPIEAMLKTINSKRYEPVSILDTYDPKSFKG